MQFWVQDFTKVAALRAMAEELIGPDRLPRGSAPRQRLFARLSYDGLRDMVDEAANGGAVLTSGLTRMTRASCCGSGSSSGCTTRNRSPRLTRPLAGTPR